jgi:calcineurin-like phosphoesterase family protein
MSIKIAIISDIHFAGAPAGEFDARVVVEAFVDWANRINADLLLDLGDRIDDIDRTSDLANTAVLARLFERFKGRRVHLLGNHDVVNLTAQDHVELFGRMPGHQAINLGQCRLLAWEPSVLLDRQFGFPSAGPNLGWLAQALDNDDVPAIIASHIPVSGASMTGNYYFENNPDFATYPDHAEVRRVVEQSGRAALWLSGHVHWNSSANVAGIRHLTVQSASETFTTMPDPACSYALLEIEQSTARLEVFGRDGMRLEIPFSPSGRAPWPQPRPRVARA